MRDIAFGAFCLGVGLIELVFAVAFLVAPLVGVDLMAALISAGIIGGFGVSFVAGGSFLLLTDPEPDEVDMLIQRRLWGTAKLSDTEAIALAERVFGANVNN